MKLGDITSPASNVSTGTPAFTDPSAPIDISAILNAGVSSYDTQVVSQTTSPWIYGLLALGLVFILAK